MTPTPPTRRQRDEMTRVQSEAKAANNAAAVSAWTPISTAPRDGTPILGYCVHSESAYYSDHVAGLTDYGARAEGLSHVDDGPHVLVWDEAFEESDGWEMPSYTIPAWWVSAHDPEAAATPTHWMPIPPAPMTATPVDSMFLSYGMKVIIADRRRCRRTAGHAAPICTFRKKPRCPSSHLPIREDWA